MVKKQAKLPSIYWLTKASAKTLWLHKGLFAGITLIFGLLNLLLVQGIAGASDAVGLKQTLDEVFTGNFGSLASGLGVFALLISSAGNSSSETAGAYQVFLTLIGSLAMIWALRQIAAGSRIRIRDTYYKGMYPLVPFVLVLFVIGLQLIPLLIGSTLYSLVMTNGIAIYFIEKLLWAVLFGVLALITLYLLSSSLLALYIVTLPDMTPLKALRSARDLVKKQRWTVLRKIFAFPIILLVAAAIIMLPVIVWVTPLAQWMFFVLTMTGLLAFHTYMYTLYRELLNE